MTKTFEQANDAELLANWQQGDETAFAALFARHYAMIVGVLHRLVASREDAEDLAQETFLALYHSPPQQREESGVAAWLARVAVHRGYNLLRSNRRALQRLWRLAEPQAEIDPQHEVLRNDERLRVRAALAELPARQAQLLALRHAGYAYREIATALALAPGSVGTLLARAEHAFEQAYLKLGRLPTSEQTEVKYL